MGKYMEMSEIQKLLLRHEVERAQMYDKALYDALQAAMDELTYKRAFITDLEKRYTRPCPQCDEQERLHDETLYVAEPTPCPNPKCSYGVEWL